LRITRAKVEKDYIYVWKEVSGKEVLFTYPNLADVKDEANKNKKEVDAMPIEFSELKPKLNLPENKKTIDELKNKTFEIKDAIVNKSQFHNGEYAIVLCSDGKEEFYFTTSSSVLIKQLKEIILPAIKEKQETVKVKLSKPKGKRYYTFE
jgi:predicted nuclease with TOPRIM domain